MNFRTTALSVPLICLSLLNGCAQSAMEPEPLSAATDSSRSKVAENQVQLPAPITTIKPGASLSFSSETTGSVLPGQTGTVYLTVNEGYPYGSLILETYGEDGLSVFGSQTVTEMDMSLGTTHSWQVDYSAELDGVYYVNVVATAKPEADFSEARAYSVRIEVGDWKTAQAESEAAKPMEMQSDGEMAVIMSAEEIIE